MGKINIYSERIENCKLDREESKNITGYASIDKPWQKYYTKEALEAPIPEMTLYEYMVGENQDNLSTTAIEYFGTKITFKKFIQKIDEAAKSFYNIGVREGDVVSILSVANPELEIAFYALNKLGAVVNFLDVRSDSSTIGKNLDDVSSKFLIAMDNFLPEVDKIINSTCVERVITISPFNSLNGIKRLLANIKENQKDDTKGLKLEIIKQKRKYISWNDFIYENKKNQNVFYPKYKKDTVAALVHTGGTTGVSKTVKLSNENFNAMAIQYNALGASYNKGDTFLNGIVPFVAYGIVVTIHMPMCLGMTNIIAPILSPKEFTDFMIKYRPNHTITVPTYVENFIEDKKANAMDWSCIKHLGVGGDSFSKDLEINTNNFLHTHKSSALIDKGYGMTELSSSSITTIDGVNKLNSLGIPLPLNTYGIFKRGTDEELKYGEEGEICITGPTKMLGYLNNKDEESKVIRLHSDGKKWIHSEDIGYIDKDGFLFFGGRYKRIIPHGGFKLYPSYIEGIIMGHPKVEKCCVISIPSVEYGASPEAHIVARKNKVEELKKIKEELVELCKDKLPSYSQPEDFIFEEDLPLTSVGKVDYKQVEKIRIKKLEESKK